MEIVQIKLKKMLTFCYLVGDEGSKKCALIDPAFETQRILERAGALGYEVTHLINTHCHSDHTAGNAAIMAHTNARLMIHELDAKRLGKLGNSTLSVLMGGKGSPRPDMLLKDGDVIDIGATSLKVIHTPGHTPGGICLYGEGNLFTGDTLFVGYVGRTDLPGGSHKLLMKSIHEKLYTLPPQTKVWPGHDYGLYSHSTVAHEKNTNTAT